MRAVKSWIRLRAGIDLDGDSMGARSAYASGKDAGAGCVLRVHGFLSFSCPHLTSVRGFPITFDIDSDQTVGVRRLM